MSMKHIAQVGIALFCGMVIYGCNSLMADSSQLYGHWTLRETQGTENPTIIDDPNVSFTLNLDKDQRASGKVACNGWHGQVRVDNDRLQLLAAGSTRKRCVYDNEALRKIERTYLSTLQRSSQFSANEKQLQLRFENGDLWIFERQTP